MMTQGTTGSPARVTIHHRMLPSGACKSTAAAGATPVALAEKRAFLERGTPWPGDPRPECIETHASLVFLTGDRAWKLKKPVNLVHVDQRSLDDRARLCREEVRLNRELSGPVYRGLVPLVQQPDGALALGGEGRIIDWIIESDRLPAPAMLDRRLASGPKPREPEIEAVCDVLAAFYRSQVRGCDAGEAYCNRLLRETRIADAHLRAMAPRADLRLPREILRFAETAVRVCRTEILRRSREGVLVEGHGDLRAEHVCLTVPPILFDRLEVNHGLRLTDPYHEIHALGIECGILGAPWIGPLLLDRLADTFPPPSGDLLTAYGVVACLTRARIALDHFRDPVVATPAKWRTRAGQYLDAATRLVAEGVHV